METRLSELSSLIFSLFFVFFFSSMKSLFSFRTMIFTLIFLLVWASTCTAFGIRPKRSLATTAVKAKICLTHITLSEKCRSIQDQNEILLLPKLVFHTYDLVGANQQVKVLAAENAERFVIGGEKAIESHLCFETALFPGQRKKVVVVLEHADFDQGLREFPTALVFHAPGVGMADVSGHVWHLTTEPPTNEELSNSVSNGFYWGKYIANAKVSVSYAHVEAKNVESEAKRRKTVETSYPSRTNADVPGVSRGSNRLMEVAPGVVHERNCLLGYSRPKTSDRQHYRLMTNTDDGETMNAVINRPKKPATMYATSSDVEKMTSTPTCVIRPHRIMTNRQLYDIPNTSP